MGVVGLVGGEGADGAGPAGRSHDEGQVGQFDAAAFGCDAAGGADPVVVLGHCGAGSFRGCSASGGTHMVIVTLETRLALSTGI